MKKICYICTLLALSVGVHPALTQPELKEFTLIISGRPNSNIAQLFDDITVELVFDRGMDKAIQPVIHYGLNQIYDLDLPVAGNWQDSTIWQGSFTITNNVPSTADGEYFFRISGAKDAGGNLMKPALGVDMGGITLFVCRAGNLLANVDTLDFGRIRAGTQRELSVTLENKSCAPLNISSFSTPAPFAIINNPGQTQLNGNQKITLRIRFSPFDRGIFDNLLIVRSANNATYQVNLHGSAKGPRIDLFPSSSLNFGKVSLGKSASDTIRVINKPASDPSLDDTLRVKIGTNSPPGIYVVSPTSMTVAPGDTKKVFVTFTPKQGRSYDNYRANFTSNDSAQSVRSIVLNGNAVDETPPPPLTNLTATWSGYNGYTNAPFLRICWKNPNDPSGIAQIWWKFSRTPAPPTGAADTTNFGSRIVLQPNASCAQLPLFGKISGGRWYCYIWLVDGNGNSGWRSAVLTRIKYDVTPPAAPVIYSRSIPATRWFGASAVFSLRALIAPDTTWGWRDAAEARWKFKMPPATPDDFDGKRIFTGAKRDTVSLTIPFNNSALCGDDTLYLWLADSSGNASEQNFAMARYRYDICPPTIKRLLPDGRNIAQNDTAFVDTLIIKDNVGVDSAWVRYRFGGAEAEQPPRALTRISGTDNFMLQLPDASVTRRGLEYRAIARDSLGNVGNGPSTALGCGGDIWFPVRTRIEGDGDFRIDSDGRPVPLIAGTDGTTYQLFSVPYDLDSSAVRNVLEDDLGKYNNKQWRIFDYNPQNAEPARWLEGLQARNFAPGRSYFIITRKENIVIDSGPGVTRRTVCPDTMRLYKGWNLIATPFTFPVSRDALSLLNSDSKITLRSFERGWNISEVLEPWRGYALYVNSNNNQPIYLVVQAKAAPGRLNKPGPQPLALKAGEWQVRIAAEAGTMQDRDNWAGQLFGAAQGFDTFELAEPPVLGKYVRVAFVHPEWQQAAEIFSTDFRPAGDTAELVWHVLVETNFARQDVQLQFAFDGDFPPGAEAYLIDDAEERVANLRANATYTFRSGAHGTRKELRLVVGSRKFARQQAGETPLQPDEFILLPNYPNPFNPETQIRYNLPEKANVRIRIYDQLGRLVRTLVQNSPQPAGYHRITWNAKDEAGRAVSSGLYLYRVEANGRAITGKMLLLK